MTQQTPEHPSSPGPARLCAACGRAVDLRNASYTVAPGGALRHATCPTRPALADASPPPVPLAGGTGPGVTSPEFLTLAEAATLLRCHPDTVRERIARGRLPAFRLSNGRTLLLRETDVRALLEPVQSRPE